MLEVEDLTIHDYVCIKLNETTEQELDIINFLNADRLWIRKTAIKYYSHFPPFNTLAMAKNVENEYIACKKFIISESEYTFNIICIMEFTHFLLQYYGWKIDNCLQEGRLISYVRDIDKNNPHWRCKKNQEFEKDNGFDEFVEVEFDKNFYEEVTQNELNIISNTVSFDPLADNNYYLEKEIKDTLYEKFNQKFVQLKIMQINNLSIYDIWGEENIKKHFTSTTPLSLKQFFDDINYSQTYDEDTYELLHKVFELKKQEDSELKHLQKFNFSKLLLFNENLIECIVAYVGLSFYEKEFKNFGKLKQYIISKYFEDSFVPNNLVLKIMDAITSVDIEYTQIHRYEYSLDSYIHKCLVKIKKIVDDFDSESWAKRFILLTNVNRQFSNNLTSEQSYLLKYLIWSHDLDFSNKQLHLNFPTFEPDLTHSLNSIVEKGYVIKQNNKYQINFSYFENLDKEI